MITYTFLLLAGMFLAETEYYITPPMEEMMTVVEVVEEEPPLLVPVVVNDAAVAPAVAVKTPAAPVAVAATPVPEPVMEEKSPKKPWGVLAVTFFLLLLSLSANVFLAWQFWQQRKVLEELVKQP